MCVRQTFQAGGVVAVPQRTAIVRCPLCGGSEQPIPYAHASAAVGACVVGNGWTGRATAVCVWMARAVCFAEGARPPTGTERCGYMHYVGPSETAAAFIHALQCSLRPGAGRAGRRQAMLESLLPPYSTGSHALRARRLSLQAACNQRSQYRHQCTRAVLHACSSLPLCSPAIITYK